MNKEHYCKYCDKKLSEKKGEIAHGCLDCHDSPLIYKIDKLKDRNKILSDDSVKIYKDIVILEQENEKTCRLLAHAYSYVEGETGLNDESEAAQHLKSGNYERTATCDTWVKINSTGKTDNEGS